MVRTQILLAEEQMRILRELAAERRSSVSELVRESVNRLLEEQEGKRRWARAREVIGKYSSGQSDISANHDKYAWED